MLHNGTNHHRYFYSWLYVPLLTQERREHRSTSVLEPLLYTKQVPPVAHLATLLCNFYNPLIESQKLNFYIWASEIYPNRSHQGCSLTAGRKTLLQTVGIEWPVNLYCSLEIDISNLCVQKLLHSHTSGDTLLQTVGTLSYRQLY